MLSGRSTVVAACSLDQEHHVLAECRRRLRLKKGDTRIELWHGSDKVPANASVEDWPGIKPKGEISEYQLIVTR
eukprot:1733660-Amphidinium_carterae.1